MGSKSTNQTSEKKAVKESILTQSHSRVSEEGAEVQWQSSIDIEMEDDGEVADERERASDLQLIYAQNGFYNKSVNKTELLTKHVYYENLKDFVDETLCSVAAKISEKKLMTEKNNSF